MRRGAALALAAVAVLAACGGVPESRQPDPKGLRPGRTAAEAPARHAQTTKPPPAPPPAPSQPPARASAVEEKNDRYAFSYSYPAAASAVPPVRDRLDGERARLLAGLRADTAEAKRDAARDGFDYRPYETSVAWKVVTDTPRFLSLSSAAYEYTGGAHGMTGYDALVWDKRAGRILSGGDVLRADAGLSGALRGPFCRALDAERAKRRAGDPPGQGGPAEFNQCPKLSDATLLLGSTDRRAVDRLGFLIGPYVAGPYAEGTYEVTLPVTPAILAVVKPEYRGAFAAR